MPTPKCHHLLVSLGERINAWRTFHTLSQDELAVLMDRSQMVVSHAERGIIITLDTLDRIANVFTLDHWSDLYTDPSTGLKPMPVADPVAEVKPPRSMKVRGLRLSENGKGVEAELWDGNGRTISEFFPTSEAPPLGVEMRLVTNPRWEPAVSA